ncbi:MULTISPECIES: DUF305 domain-containing protein [unclassified Streptomyces]|uniref:DUF305 domain-containing protein n=1 Tax=unclassified Streptomyces TaxID=2593676 RepID=UPI002E35E977|nr:MULTISPECIES: DUF305 domain-containing protein [unclassified Streptomyces]WUC63736.1 DUF305 domain-containing protein [Streptomyces sp. NBC_00539]
MTGTTLRRISLTATATAAGLLLAACGHGGGAATSGTEHGAPTASRAAAFGAADVTFAQQMIPHHQQAVEMAALADGRAQDSEVKTLAAAIRTAQDPEIRTMKSWLTAWGQPESGSAMPGMNHGSGAHDGSGMSGMMSDQDMKDLDAAKGGDFDKEFARLMIAHHDGAIAMARAEQKDGLNPSAKKLADEVVKAQSAEVEQLKKILARL